eukprot:TRINITY_DN3403_c1_g2_i2.p1 TRINITY_DN3403_c1_g2~~TRINITY_DN3403_c1_g2_i2.p1  ORF type:complete len:530 (+),score=83.91 TRINITY_DN3403_c1_g2_i2:171-1760(+)
MDQGTTITVEAILPTDQSVIQFKTSSQSNLDQIKRAIVARDETGLFASPKFLLLVAENATAPLTVDFVRFVDCDPTLTKAYHAGRPLRIYMHSRSSLAAALSLSPRSSRRAITGSQVFDSDPQPVPLSVSMPMPVPVPLSVLPAAPSAISPSNSAIHSTRGSPRLVAGGYRMFRDQFKHGNGSLINGSSGSGTDSERYMSGRPRNSPLRLPVDYPMEEDSTCSASVDDSKSTIRPTTPPLTPPTPPPRPTTPPSRLTTQLTTVIQPTTAQLINTQPLTAPTPPATPPAPPFTTPPPQTTPPSTSPPTTLTTQSATQSISQPSTPKSKAQMLAEFKALAWADLTMRRMTSETSDDNYDNEEFPEQPDRPKIPESGYASELYTTESDRSKSVPADNVPHVNVNNEWSPHLLAKPALITFDRSRPLPPPPHLTDSPAATIGDMEIASTATTTSTTSTQDHMPPPIPSRGRALSLSPAADSLVTLSTVQAAGTHSPKQMTLRTHTSPTPTWALAQTNSTFIVCLVRSQSVAGT